MIYVWLYLGIGLMCFVVVYTSNYLKTPKKSELAKAILVGRETRPHRLSEWTLENLVVPMLAMTFVILAWPLLIYWKLKSQDNAKEEQGFGQLHTEFVVAKEHLIKAVALAEIERQEIVTDPLAAVPNLPFGHLNSTWERFKGLMRPSDEIWSFTATLETDLGQEVIRQGYVLVRAGIPHEFILNGIRYSKR